MRDQLQLQTKVWIERDGQVAVSSWRIALLEAIDTNGSLAAAARQMDVPYRTAWQKLKQMEARCHTLLVVSETGGDTGGSSRLTPEARELIRRFHQIERGLREQALTQFEQLFADGLF